MKFLEENFFTISVLIALASGLLWQGAAVSLSQYRSALLFFVMFLVGLEQTLPELAKQFGKLGAISLSLVMSYAVFPILAWAVGYLFFGFGTGTLNHTPLLAGFVVLGAVPTTLTSAVIYTRLDKGNERLALVIVLLSQILCVAITPLLVAFFMNVVSGGVQSLPANALVAGSVASLNVTKMMEQLLIYFLCPLCLGMFFGRFLPLEKIKPYLMRPEQLVVALFVFMGAGRIPAETSYVLIGKTIVAVILIQAAFAIWVRLIIRSYHTKDQTALYYTATQKTLSVGLYLLLTYFPSAAVLPMVLYHLSQLTIGRLYRRFPSKA